MRCSLVRSFDSPSRAKTLGILDAVLARSCGIHFPDLFGGESHRARARARVHAVPCATEALGKDL